MSRVWKILTVLVLCIFSVSEPEMRSFPCPCLVSCMAPQWDRVRQERPTVADPITERRQGIGNNRRTKFKQIPSPVVGFMKSECM